MRLNRTFQDRLIAIPFGKTLISIALLGCNFLFGSIPRSKTPTVAERVALVRQALAKGQLTPPIAPRQTLDDKDLAPGFATAAQTAQWINWNNWANWANFHNWNNWANWLNFLNH